MSLADKMFNRFWQMCGLKTTCREEADRKYVRDLFAGDWEVFVIRHDRQSGGFDTFTLCCEAANIISDVKPNVITAASC